MKQSYRVKPFKYFILLIAVIAPVAYTAFVASRVEFGGMLMEEVTMFSLWLAFFVVAWPLPIMLTYDLCRIREKSLQAMVFPFLFSWLGFFLVWLLMRQKGETEYPFQKIF